MLLTRLAVGDVQPRGKILFRCPAWSLLLRFWNTSSFRCFGGIYEVLQHKSASQRSSTQLEADDRHIMALAKPVRALALVSGLVLFFLVIQIFRSPPSISRPKGFTEELEREPNLERMLFHIQLWFLASD